MDYTLYHKVLHALRAYTPNEQKAIKAAADGLRSNPLFDTKEAIQSLATGEALVSFITENGEPSIVEKVTILPPQSRMGAISAEERAFVINNSPIANIYETKTNEISAQEMNEEEINRINTERQAEQDRIAEEKRLIEEQKQAEKLRKEEEKEEAKKKREEEKALREAEKAKKNSVGYKLGKKVANKTADKVINKGLNAIFKNLFK